MESCLACRLKPRQRESENHTRDSTTSLTLKVEVISGDARCDFDARSLGERDYVNNIRKLWKVLSGNMNTQNALRTTVGVMNRLKYFRSTHNAVHPWTVLGQINNLDVMSRVIIIMLHYRRTDIVCLHDDRVTATFS